MRFLVKMIIDPFYCVVFILMFILLVYYGIFNQAIEIKDPVFSTDYSIKELDSLIENLVDLSEPGIVFNDTYYPLPYFKNAIESLAKDDDEYDRKLRQTITHQVEPIPTNTIEWSDSNWVGGDDLFSDLKEWSSDVTVLANLGARLLKLTKALANQTKNSSFLDKKYLDAIITSCQALQTKIEAWPYKDNTFPWGANWYQFSVSIPYYFVCIYYLLRNIYNWAPTEIDKVKTAGISWISKLTQSPKKGIGWTRTGPNTILMGMPWTVVQYWNGVLDEIKTQDDVVYMMAQANVNTVVSGEGMRPDGGYIFHTNVRAYGYVASSLKSANILNCLLSNNFGEMYQYLSNLMCHPNIDANLAGLFSREPTVKRFMNAGQFGAFAQFSGGVLTYKQSDWFIQMMGCIKGVAYYEADKAQDRWAPAWIMLREMWTRGSLIRQYDSKTLTCFPGYTRMKSDVSGESPAFPTKTSTTTSMIPAQASSACLIQDDISILLSSWIVDVSVEPKCYYTLLNGYQYSEITWLDKRGRTTLVYFKAADIEKETVVHTMELGVVLQTQKNGVIRFTNGKNIYAIVGTTSNGELTDIGFRDGHTEKQMPFYIEPVKDGNGNYLFAYSVWFDNSSENIDPIYTSVNLIYNYRGITLSVNNQQFIITSITTDKGILSSVQYILPDKLDTGEIGMWSAAACQANPLSGAAFSIARLFENLPLGIMPEYIEDGDRPYTITYLWPMSYDSDKFPGVTDTGYYFLVGAHDFKFQATFTLYRWLKKVDWTKQNTSTTQGHNSEGFYWPLPELRETSRAISYGSGIAFSYLGPKCKEEITTNSYKALEEKYGHTRATVPDDKWDKWKF